jgi:hypothetical protein
VSKKQETDEDNGPVEVNYRLKHRDRNHRKAVPFKHLNHPPHRLRRFLGYMLVAVVAFWFLHFVLHLG